MLHVKFEIYGCSDFREKVILMDLKAMVNVNCERIDGRTENQTHMSQPAKQVRQKWLKKTKTDCKCCQDYDVIGYFTMTAFFQFVEFLVFNLLIIYITYIIYI